jgi:hypothetical protein
MSNKILLFLKCLSLVVFLGLPGYLKAQVIGCSASDACFDFNYKGYVINNNNTVTLTIGVRTNCIHDLSHVAFELPAGAKATNPTHSNSAFTYTLENTTNNPYYSLKFNAANAAGYKYGVEDNFSYTLTAAQFNSLTTFRALAKAATTVGTVTFNAKGCCANTIAMTGAENICSGSNQTYSVTPLSGNQTYSWTFPTGWSVLSGGGTASVTVKTNAIAGTVKVQAGFNTCATKTVSILTPIVPAVPGVIVGPSSVCKNGIYSFEVPAVANADYYNWIVPAGWQIVSSPVLNGFGNKITVNAGTTGGTVSVSAVANVCLIKTSLSISKAVTVVPDVAIVNISGDGNPCYGSTQSYTVNATNANTFAWTVPAGDTIITGQGTNTITVLIKNSSPHQLGVTATGQNNCSSVTGNLNIQAKGCCIYTVAMTGDANICSGSNQTYSVTPLAGNQTYSWAFPAGWSVVSGGGTASVTVKTNANVGTVKVQAGFYSCATRTVSILAPVVPSAPGAIVGPSSVCKNGTYSFEVPAVVNADYYNWTVPAGWQIVSNPVLNGFGNKITVNAGTTGGTVSASAVANVCLAKTSLSISKAVTVVPDVAIVNISGDGNPCYGSTQSYTVNATNANTFAWTVPAGDSILTGQGTNTITLLVKNAGPNQLSVTATGQNNCSSVTGNLNIQVKAPQSINVQPVPVASYSGKNASFSVNATGSDLAYKWQVNSGSGWQNITDNATYKNSATATLQLINIPTSMNNSQYRCVISGCGPVLNSDAAVLTVTQAISVNIKVLLEGPYNPATGFMNTGMNASNLIPLTQPYNNAYWNYYGTENVAPGFFAANPDLVDWVLVEIRSGLNPGQVVGISANFLKKDGSVVGLDGHSLPFFTNVADGNYFVIVHHRNHLSIISRNMILLNANPQHYDFTTDYEKSYGVNPVKRTADGKWAMYAGDANANGSVTTSDWNSFWKKENGQSGYLKSDWNLDGIVNQADYTLWYGNGGATTQVLR